jgi:hypothetical protein
LRARLRLTPPLPTMTVTSVLCPTLPAASKARDRRVWLPLGKLVVFQENLWGARVPVDLGGQSSDR